MNSLPSSSLTGTSLMVSSSDSSTTNFLRVAALLEGRTGDTEAIAVELVSFGQCGRAECMFTSRAIIVYSQPYALRSGKPRRRSVLDFQVPA